ncbi:MAG: hypothetical protein NT144_00240 [Bacteroidia bacterium]|nr:hypothetical protein [Bacteroidia bacterium]
MGSKISKEQLTNLIVDNAISLLEEALKSEENAISFGNNLFEKYHVGLSARENLFEKFYITFVPYFGKYLYGYDVDEEDYCWPYEIDETTSDCIKNYISQQKLNRYEETQENLFNKLYKINMDTEHYDMLELILTPYHNDLFYISALMLFEEKHELFEKQIVN